MLAPTRHSRWLHEAAVRFRSGWRLKTTGIIAGIAVFMALYFTLLRHPAFPVHVIPLTPLDRFVGFAPWAIVLYVSLWVYISIVPALLEWSELPRYLAAAVLLSVVGFVSFFLWPTAVPPPGIDWGTHPAVAFLKTVDAAGNACPSLHVAFAVLSALWLRRLLGTLGAPAWIRWLNGLWCLGILYSTLAVKQHVALDLYAGAALGAAVALPFLRFRPTYLSAVPQDG
ncbi:MAG: phosphatase PAP2 family protein [Bacillota bacterium]